ncbi:glucose-6-phosphate isomerase [Roseovarius sp. MMSF_3281]|uniref:glucose-6-phosphate isomerase n=1 Tax=Roseovarius sp. MMSF_3281 TaxID=3046694 RepID=UPI00273E80A0|nr:glucose-6-phosphate isomerase [Roseovarius sp. MMSF_3281]
MKISLKALGLVAMMGVAGCMSAEQEREMTGALVGGGLGLVSAKVLGADNDWVVVSTLAGAAAGALVARHRANNQCAYANGDGTYYRAPCR